MTTTKHLLAARRIHPLDRCVTPDLFLYLLAIEILLCSAWRASGKQRLTGTAGYLDRRLTRRKGARAFPRISRRPIDHIQLNKLGLADSIDQGRLHCQVGKLALVQRAWRPRHEIRKNMPTRKSLRLCFMLDLDCTGLTQLRLGTPASCWLPPGWRCSRLRKSCAIGDRSPSAQFAVENHKFPFGKPNFFRFGRAPRGYPKRLVLKSEIPALSILLQVCNTIFPYIVV